jgi:hypothetical protein
MALLLITISDRPDGTVEIGLKVEPPMQPGQKDATRAQVLAAAALTAIEIEMKDGPDLIMPPAGLILN